jgi:hypothetical protein
MKINSLVPIGLAKNIMATIDEKDIISYEANVGTTTGSDEMEISILEVKIAFATSKKEAAPPTNG